MLFPGISRCYSLEPPGVITWNLQVLLPGNPPSHPPLLQVALISWSVGQSRLYSPYATPDAADLTAAHAAMFYSPPVCVRPLASVISSDGPGGMDCSVPAHLSPPRDKTRRRTRHSCPRFPPIDKLNISIFRVSVLVSAMSVNHGGGSVLRPQGGGPGEPAYRQPHGAEQPLHPGGSREQLLSLWHGSESTGGGGSASAPAPGRGWRPGRCPFIFIAGENTRSPARSPPRLRGGGANVRIWSCGSAVSYSLTRVSRGVVD